MTERQTRRTVFEFVKRELVDAEYGRKRKADLRTINRTRTEKCTARNAGLVADWVKTHKGRLSPTGACERVAKAYNGAHLDERPIGWRTVQRAVEAAGEWPKKH